MEHLKAMTRWLQGTANAKFHRCNSSHFFRWHLILSLIFQHVRICAVMTPKEAHDRILMRLQQDYYPLYQNPTLCHLGIQALVLVRYFWLAAKMLFLELYLLDLVFWKIHRYARQRNILPQYTRIFSPGFHRLAVLAPLPPSRFRYLMARIVASIWYWWASFLGVPLMAWIVFTATKS